MKRILVPTDFSPTAEKAFRFAVDLASRSKGTIILYHVYTPVESTFVDTEQTRKEYNLRAETNVLKKLQRLRKRVIGNVSDVTVSTIIGRSPLINNILSFADNNHIDLILMGTQGASGLKKNIIGSVAARIIEKSTLPVLLVPAKYELGNPGQFAFATDNRASDKQALRLIEEFANQYGSDITVLHLVTSKTPESANSVTNSNATKDTHLSKLMAKHSKMCFKTIETSSVSETMQTLDKTFPYDILIMVRRKKTFIENFFLKSFTKNMAYMTTKPLLIIPE
jgi:nucleotide-binding universal stress UspA family protein